MAKDWTTLRELLLPAVSGPGARGKALEQAIREAVRDGRLRPGVRLPSSRDLAAQLGLARGTVTASYEQLVAEGYLTARHGSGTRIAAAVGPAESPAPAPATDPQWRFDLRPGLPALGAFPRAAWLAATRAALTEMPDAALGYPDPSGLAELRAELAGYLGRVRSVVTDPAGITVTHGAAEALALLAQVLRDRGLREIAVENPSHPGQAELLAAQGLRPVPVPVDCDGVQVDALARTGVRAVLVTAAHQFPLGTALTAPRRHALLAWARERDAVVIEDDYDAEHRYDRPSVCATQSLDPSRVAYIGSVSKILAPALRLGWLVLPADLRGAIADRKRLHDLGCGPIPQAALARFLREGGYDRHLRRTRLLYRGRRDALLTALAEHLPDWRTVGIAAGLHLVVRLPAGMDDAALSARLAAAGINAPALSGYAHPPVPAPYPGLVLGYAALSTDRLRAAVGEIARIVGAVAKMEACASPS
ncbi:MULTISPECIES: PLP-dependent aminotransferase family protein [unclassified Crossiella]|uniref:MocR-like pyridoxine biosynthesis transcription factor PdxR n=1 Tax=unclassified Crossiella TaxID=2620835 RepID=UPI001FFE48F9|nr:MULTISPECIES: PLP-dependent aminotransferase family protein [unclassified Crossiella]MCK2237125.1 PLP-dependent aminotransferase family protein [Crossiella sp. S99.2]MCK2250793.1 PLP-dependent aminotransferase family protein [Crossiella sp. S99.1]